MARSVGVSVENNFTRGFLTEFSGLNFPENSCLDVDNCMFTEQGEVFRRDPIDFEYGYANNTTNYNASNQDAVVSYLWTGVGLVGSISFAVWQIGSKIHFWTSNVSDVSISSSKKSFTVDIDSLKVSGAPSTSTEKCSFVSGNGRLFVAHRYCQPFYITYDGDTDTISTTTVTIKVRDFGIQDDGLSADAQPTTLSNEHKYNLINQGWPATEITNWYTNNANYPAKSMIVWYFRSATGGAYDFRPAYRKYYPTVGGSLAPRGYVLLDAFNQQRSTVSGVTGIPDVSSGYQRPTCVAFMNSRVFYAGTKSSGFSSSIYFSTIIKPTDDELLFHQRNDPTSEVANELLSNDGGTIVIPEADTIIAMAAAKSYLLVFCTNGVWAIGGSQGIGFSATDYMVQRISNVPVISPSSVMIVDNTPIWWNYDGIYSITVNLENLQPSSMTLGTIQSFYDSIPNVCKLNVYPYFNRLTSEIGWLYSTNESTPTQYTNILVYKATTKSFYKHSVTQGYSSILGALVVTNATQSTTIDTVVDTSLALVTTTTSDPIVISVVESSGDIDSSFPMFLVTSGAYTTFATFQPTTYIDWLTLGNSVSYTSYLTPAYRVRGDGIRKFQVNNIEVYSRASEDSSCLFRGVWDYSNNEAANGYTSWQQVYNSSPHRTVASRRLRVRGSGRTINFEFTSDGVKPFHLIGWVSQDIVNDSV